MDEIKIEEEMTQVRVEKYKLLKVSPSQSKTKEKKTVQKVPRQTFQKACKQPKEKFRTGKWTVIEKQLYQRFVVGTKLNWDKKQRNKKRINYFQEMSKFIKTRSPAQCKSHDQKMRHKLMIDGIDIKEEADIKEEFDASPDYTTMSVNQSDSSADRTNSYLPSVSRENDSSVSESCLSKDFMAYEYQPTLFGKPLLQNMSVSDLVLNFWASNLPYSGKFGEYLGNQTKLFQQSASEQNNELDVSFEIMYTKLLRKRMLEVARTLIIEDF